MLHFSFLMYCCPHLCSFQIMVVCVKGILQNMHKINFDLTKESLSLFKSMQVLQLMLIIRMSPSSVTAILILVSQPTYLLYYFSIMSPNSGFHFTNVEQKNTLVMMWEISECCLKELEIELKHLPLFYIEREHLQICVLKIQSHHQCLLTTVYSFSIPNPISC